MLNDDSIENGKKTRKQNKKQQPKKNKATTTTMIGPIGKKKKNINNFARAAHFFVHFFGTVVPRLQLETF